jgi:hypothetical protein
MVAVSKRSSCCIVGTSVLSTTSSSMPHHSAEGDIRTELLEHTLQNKCSKYIVVNHLQGEDGFRKDAIVSANCQCT